MKTQIPTQDSYGFKETSTETDYDFDEILAKLESNEVATVPTETVEGYAVRLNSEKALARLIKLKDRNYNSGKIFTLIPASPEEFKTYAEISKTAEQLIEKYIPGELTLILPKNPHFRHPYYDHFEAIGLRIPNHPLILKLLEKTGPIILTSANPRGGTPKSLGKKPSTILDLTEAKPKIIRQGDLEIDPNNL